ncbi:hypothetical protein H0H93_005842 [Arthromyces matolae]|nr:hypothetical protein H0H93_005842 [Arthromyces matolae]
MAWPWFGPIANNMVTDFGISLDEVNWLGNIMALVYFVTALVIPNVVSRYGLRRCCDVGAVSLLLSAWLRYAGTAKTLSPSHSYALLIIGQLFASIAQPVYQVIGPKYSETWFDLKGRTTATMILAIANPIGGAIGQLISPLPSTTRQSILILGILATAVTPSVFFVGAAPPTPPTYAGSKVSPSLLSLVRTMLGLKTSDDAYMTPRERVDFAVITFIFGTIAGGTNAWGILTAQVMEPMGYTSNESGFFGACLLLTGIVAAIITAPLFDRVFTHHLALTAKLIVPIVGVSWLSLIWAVKPDNLGALFAIMTIIGVCSLTMLPVGLELGCELTRNANASSAVLWSAWVIYPLSHAYSTLTTSIVQGALRAGPDANPPLNMRRSLIFNGTFMMIAAASVFALRGRQVRKELDEEKQRGYENTPNTI